MRRGFMLAAALLLAGLSGACGTFGTLPKHHILMLSGSGEPLDPGTTLVSDKSRFASTFLFFNELHVEDSRARMDELLEALRQFRSGEYEYANIQRRLMGQPPCAPGETARVTMIVHGGMVTQPGSFEESIEIGNTMLRECNFPIFVNWLSGFTTSYLAHLLATRQGENVWYGWNDPSNRTQQSATILSGVLLGLGLSPFYLAEDLATGVVMLPHSVYSEIQSSWISITESGTFDARHWRWIRTERQNLARDAYETIQQSETPTFTARRGEDRRGWWERSWSWVLMPFYMPVKIGLSPVVRGMGGSAWQEMRRRVKLMSHQEFHSTRDGLAPDEPGELQALMQALAGPGGLRASDDVTLIGHSMGTIVANEILLFERLPAFDNLVFMAAATTIRDYQMSVFPYLQDHPETQMYHLTLHTQAEENEAPAFGLVLRGSLLVWIDQFLETPHTTRDVTAGRWLNLLEYAHDTPTAKKRSIREQIHFKSFDAGSAVDATNPQTHGALNDVNYFFWREEYWQ